MSASVSFEVEADAGNHLAWMNAILGLQRTLMAAERAAVTLIAFGFTVAQVFRNLGEEVPPQFLFLGPNLPRDLGLLMIAAGVGSLTPVHPAVSARGRLSRREPFDSISLRIDAPLDQLTFLTAYAILLLGALGFASVFLSS